MNISYEYYRIFYYVAKCQSITRAALFLESNQPNITRTIKNLEQQLNCILFIRSRHGVQLTAEGKKLFEHLQIAFEHIEAAEEELALEKTLQHGTISIGTSEIALHCLLLPILKEYRTLYPQIRIRLFSLSTPQAISALKDGHIDLAVVTTPADVPKSLTCTIIKNIQEVAVCGTAFSHLSKQQLSLAQLAEYPLIGLGSHTTSYEFYSALFAKHGIHFSPSVEASTTNQIMPLVMHDLGIGFVPEEFLTDIEKGGIIHQLQLSERIPPRSICSVKRTGFSLGTAAKKLEEMLLSLGTTHTNPESAW